MYTYYHIYDIDYKHNLLQFDIDFRGLRYGQSAPGQLVLMVD
jgi:hypothetical protein